MVWLTSFFGSSTRDVGHEKSQVTPFFPYSGFIIYDYVHSLMSMNDAYVCCYKVNAVIIDMRLMVIMVNQSPFLINFVF